MYPATPNVTAVRLEATAGRLQAEARGYTNNHEPLGENTQNGRSVLLPLPVVGPFAALVPESLHNSLQVFAGHPRPTTMYRACLVIRTGLTKTLSKGRSAGRRE